jgi:hypothetical protein
MKVLIKDARVSDQTTYNSGYIVVDAVFTDDGDSEPFVTIPVSVSANASAIDIKAAVEKVSVTVFLARETIKRLNDRAAPMSFEVP